MTLRTPILALALRLPVGDKVKVRQDGLKGWNKKGVFKADEVATEMVTSSAGKPAGH